MARIRVVFLWHMHQPYYKDLVKGQYRLPWTRLHALKDYYGMVKLLDEFPTVHQTFNLVPSLIAQIQDYVSGGASDPFLDIVSKPARDLTEAEKHFAVSYLFQANASNMIGRYPRYQELLGMRRECGEKLDHLGRVFRTQDYADLQALSQLAWFDEFFLLDPEVAGLVKKGRDFSDSDQRFIIGKQREILASVLPAYASAAKRNLIEISTSPYYHPILPLVCDTDQGRASSPGLQLPKERYQHPEDAEEQLRRGMDLHEQVFGVRPLGAWPSEGSVSEEVFGIAHKLGIKWMATDEGVLGRTLGHNFQRDDHGNLLSPGPELLYKLYRYERADANINVVFRDHSMSDLIGFVYSGMPAKDAANHLLARIRDAAKPLLAKGKAPLIPIILDGENAWEYYPESGREFLRRVYDGIATSRDIEAVTISEAIERQESFGSLKSLVPGSWINANFNVWIGAPEDNRAWDYLKQARDFYAQESPRATGEARQLAFEEILIAEGSDWNWWYGPEHHSANDRDFDELYRAHLSNVYTALGVPPPEYLAQPIAAGAGRPYFVPQTAFIYPRIEGFTTGYFDWLGAAMYTADRRSSAMHGKEFLLDAAYAGVNEDALFARLDFIKNQVPDEPFSIVLNVERGGTQGQKYRLEIQVVRKVIAGWKLTEGENGDSVLIGNDSISGTHVELRRNLELQLPLMLIKVREGSALRLRFSLWRERLPIDALPIEGWIELRLVTEEHLAAQIYA